MGVMRRAIVAACAALCLAPAAGHAYDTGPHADMTRDAMTAEGFSAAGANAAMVNNWFTDYYSNPDDNPYSGHANALIGLTRLGLRRENWPRAWIEGARKMHFDAETRSPQMPNLATTAGVESEWQRLMFVTRERARLAAQRNDPLLLMAVIGTSLHSVQDFYTHSNWVEESNLTFGRGGPALASRGFGQAPTWFDVPPDIRRTLSVFTGVAGIPRGHGTWQSDKNATLFGGLNKDWPGRPKYIESYSSGYFATRQWIRAIRGWVSNEALWRRARTLRDSAPLRHDVTAAEDVSKFTGHWQGAGEPCAPGACGERVGNAGSLVSTRLALGDFHDRGPTPYRRAFNELIASWGSYPSADRLTLPELPGTRADQVATRFVKLEVAHYRGISLGDTPGSADIYANARIRGQPFTSTVINGEDSFSFPGSYAPFTWIRSLPAGYRAREPVTSMTVQMKTGGKTGAGTDDDVYLRVGGERYSLDKGLYDDFERNDDDTYSVPIGAATRAGMTMADIDRVSIEKSKDGLAGGWYLGGMTLRVNGRVVARDRSINRWLEDSKRKWTASSVTPTRATSAVVPVWLELREDDFGRNDTGDINEYDRHTSLPIAYRLGSILRRQVTGDDRLKGRKSIDNGDRARLTYRLTTFGLRPPR